jgi:ribosomal 50S subunit-associated protein YjgA (DUF615 family)
MAISEQLLRIERWRFGLIEEGLDAIEAFLLAYPAADRKLLKQRMQSAAAMHHKHGTHRKLLRYIRVLDVDARDSSPVDEAL